MGPPAEPSIGGRFLDQRTLFTPCFLALRMTDVFVNLSTKDLPAATAFYEGLGLKFNPAFSNDDAASFIIDQGRYLHLLTHSFFSQFTRRPIADGSSVECTLALGAADRAAVDAMAEKVLKLGGGEENPPQDHGFMYGRTMRDLDGHIIEFFWMDPSQMPGA